MKTIAAVNEKIRRGEAQVRTAEEFKSLAGEGERIGVDDVDVVTTGTFGVMSGTYALLSFRIAPGGFFSRAEKVFLNGVPAFPGPCPNERLGIVDVIVYGTAAAGPAYGGGHLFRDIVEGDEIEVTVESKGMEFRGKVTLAEMGTARLVTTRSAFRNYNAVINCGKERQETIFSVTGLAGEGSEASVSGCGDINPLQNDPRMRTVGIGTSVLLNGGPGYILGQGTRSSPGHPNLSAIAEMKGMDPRMMGGFRTSEGPECLTSLAVPIPVLDEEILAALMVKNRDIPLPVVDIRNREQCGQDSYAPVWDGTDIVVRYDGGSCLDCDVCMAEKCCPTGAASRGKGIDRDFCVNCGTCTRVCQGGCFTGELGVLTVGSRTVPVTLRQSDRSRAGELCRRLKRRILDGTFLLTELWERA